MAARSWIFLRGLVRGSGHWGDFVELFQAKYPQDEVELIDLPGNGLRFAETSPTSVAEFVADLRSRSQSLAQGKKVHLLGLSLGGMIVTEWHRTHPEEVEKSFLVCTSSARHARLDERFLPSNYPRLMRIARMEKGLQQERGIVDLIANNEERKNFLLPRLSEHSVACPFKVSNLLRQLWAASQYQFPDLPPGEVKLIGAHGDRLVSPQCTLKLAQAWGLQAVMHPWSGHDLPIDDPNWLLQQLN